MGPPEGLIRHCLQPSNNNRYDYASIISINRQPGKWRSSHIITFFFEVILVTDESTMHDDTLFADKSTDVIER